MRKDILEKKAKRLEEKRDRMKEKAMASEDVAEVRNINELLEDINIELEEVRAEIKAIEEETEERAKIPADAKLVNGDLKGSFKNEERETDFMASMEYRKAFMKFAQTGEAITRNGEVISTADTGAAIPITVMREVINTVRKRYGNLYAKVAKTNMKGGVEYPVGALKATFKWITESTVSPRQKLDPLAKVSFSYHTAEIRIAQTFLSSIVTLEDFEAKIAEVIAVAYVQNMDMGIVNGSGNGQMLGILNDPRVTGLVGHSIDMTEDDMSDWTAWRKNFFAKLPLGYRAGEFIFSLGTVDTYLETMADANNNPIFRQATGLEVNDGDAMNPNGRFFGRNISLVEPDILPDYDSASDGDVIGIYWQPEEYAINENFGFMMRRYFDEGTNEWVDKAIVVVDGKVLNPEGYYLIKKKV